MKVFYSWQSDSPREANFYFIDKAIKNAIKELNKENTESVFIPDRDTKNEAGAVDIRDTILKKISESDILIYDISIINPNESGGKKVINPNVAFELGYGVAHKSWQNIILLFNNHYGKIESIPFDITRHRAMTYDFDGNKQNEKKLLAELSMKLKDAILSIVNNPIKYTQMNKFSFEIERERVLKDTSCLNDFFCTFDIDSFETFHRELQQKGESEVKILDFYKKLDETVDSAKFFMYDKQALNYIKKFYKDVKAAMNTETCYLTIDNQSIFIRSDCTQEVRELFINRVGKAKRSIELLIKYLKEQHYNVNIQLEIEKK